jgi:hypothetical protein
MIDADDQMSHLPSTTKQIYSTLVTDANNARLDAIDSRIQHTRQVIDNNNYYDNKEHAAA